MLNTLKQLLGFGPATDYADLIKQNAIILDVRTKNEFKSGNIKKSINIPVDVLHNNLKHLKDKNRPIITCCASGARSAMAKRLLKSQGYTQVYNGGGWYRLQSKIAL